MLRYHTHPVTAFAQNCSIVWDDETKQAAVIDPGGDLPELLAVIDRLGLKLEHSEKTQHQDLHDEADT